MTDQPQIDQHLENKQRLHNLWNDINGASLAESQTLLREALTPDVHWAASHPINGLDGVESVMTDYWTPLKQAMPNVRRDHYILIGDGEDGTTWTSATGYFHGKFETDWLGFPVAGHMVHLRFGEFNRMADGKIAETYIILDFVDMLRQVGVEVLPKENAGTGYVPGPIDGDGVRLWPYDTDMSDASRDLVHAMIYEGLMRYDQHSLASMNMKTYWNPNMIWYGPAGIGTTHGLTGFEDYHQRPFLRAFPDRKGGDHVAQLADGPYVATGGWPSINATHAGNYLGLPATNKQITMRVMDWWRAADGQLDENWVLIDLPDLFLQMGKDLFAGVRS